jgi:hypothetical protein
VRVGRQVELLARSRSPFFNFPLACFPWLGFNLLLRLGHSSVCKQDREQTTSPGKEVHDPWAFYLLPFFIDRLMGRGWLAGNPILEPTTCFPTAETDSKRDVR